MFKSLQAWLTLSHILIILVCLVLVGIAALLLQRGYQQNLMYRRLVDRATLAGGSVALMVRRGASPEEVMERLSLQMNRDGASEAHLYLLNQDGLLIAASDKVEGIRELGQMRTGTGASATLPSRGVLWLAGGERLLYVAESVRIPAEGSQRAANYQDLVVNVSHELKTPLTSIQGFSQALLDGTAGDAAAQLRAASVIHEEAGRMRRLVDDLLDLARLEAGEVSLRSEPVDVSDLMLACVERYAPVADESGTTLVVQVSQSLPMVVGDADRLEQVFGNLVDNAIKPVSGAEGNGQVTLGAVQDDGWILCSVTYNGPGIPAEELDRIFERFYQVDKSRSRRMGGAGLGLSIAQQIVLGHGGCIRAESVEGLGTRITVELPLA